MNRRIAIATLTVLLAGALAPGARAQYGGYGWRGWGGGATVGGSVAQGMGVFAAGVGQYNRQTAEAEAINTDTRMRLNEYLWESEQIRRQQYYQQVAARKAERNQARKEIEMRHLYKPQRADIVSGDALNAILHQLRSPSVPDSVIEMAGSGLTLSGEQVKDIPFMFASKGIVISAHRLASESWPDSLSGPAFEDLRKQYQSLVEEVRNRPEDTEVPDKTIVQAINIIEQMREAAKRELSGPEFAEAERYLKTHAGLLQMARKPDIQQVLRKAYEQKSIPLANALLFMDVFNLQFGKADDTEEVSLYIATLYPMLAELRGRVAKQLGGEIPDEYEVAAADQLPTGAFDKMDWQLLGRDEPHGAAPPPANEE